MLNFDIIKNNSNYLDINKFNEKFDEIWSKMEVSFKKLECLQYYDESKDSPMFNLMNKDIDGFVKKLKFQEESEKPFYDEPIRKKVELSRLHLIEFPISDYIKFEYYSYYITNKLGENIFFDNIKKYNINVEDLIIFDGRYMFVNDYDKYGKARGAWYIEPSCKVGNYVSEVENWFDSVIKKAANFKQLMVPDKNILERIL